jgi:hypothetical protein
MLEANEGPVTTNMVPQVGTMDAVVPPAPVEIDTANENFGRELAKIAAEQGMVIDPVTGNAVPAQTKATAPAPTPTPAPEATPTEPAAETSPPPEAVKTEVPAKFQDKDGNLDTQKLEKSTRSVEETLAKYREMEKELTKTMQSVAEHKKQAQAPAVPSAPSDPNRLTFDQVTPEMLKQGIEQNGADAVLRDLRSLYNESKNAPTPYPADSALQERLSALEGMVTAQARADELRAIAKADPYVFTDEGMAELVKIRQKHPHINQSAEPWREAYLRFKGEQALNQSAPQVQTPNPTAKAGRVPPTPVNAAAQTQQDRKIDLTSKENLVSELNSMSPEEEAKFWAKAVPWSNKIPIR